MASKNAGSTPVFAEAACAYFKASPNGIGVEPPAKENSAALICAALAYGLVEAGIAVFRWWFDLP